MCALKKINALWCVAQNQTFWLKSAETEAAMSVPGCHEQTKTESYLKKIIKMFFS